MTIAQIYFIMDKRNGKVYKPDGKISLVYGADKILHAIFKEGGLAYDVPYNQMRIIKMA